MAMENKRIIQLSTERTTLGDDDYTIVDSDTNGTAKYRLSRLKETDTTLSVSGMAADAAATGQAISDEAQARTQAVTAETQARQQAIEAESQARQAADTTLGNDVDDLKSAISEFIENDNTVAGKNTKLVNVPTGGLTNAVIYPTDTQYLTNGATTFIGSLECADAQITKLFVHLVEYDANGTQLATPDIEPNTYYKLNSQTAKVKVGFKISTPNVGATDYVNYKWGMFAGDVKLFNDLLYINHENVVGLNEFVDEKQQGLSSDISNTINDRYIDLLANVAFEKGSLSKSAEIDNSTRIRSNYIDVSNLKALNVSVSAGFKYCIYCYTDIDEYVTTENAGTYYTELINWKTDAIYVPLIPKIKYLRFLIANTSDSDAVSVADKDKLHISSDYPLYNAVGDNTVLASITSRQINGEKYVLSHSVWANGIPNASNNSINSHNGRIWSGIIRIPKIKGNIILATTAPYQLAYYIYDNNFDKKASAYWDTNYSIDILPDYEWLIVGMSYQNPSAITPSAGANGNISFVMNTENNVPSYFKTNLSSAIAEANENVFDIGITGDSFIFLTDLHWQSNEKHSPILVKEVLKRTNVGKVICGGDLIGGGAKSSMVNLMMNCIDSFKDVNRFYSLLGNHDTNKIGAPSENDYFSKANAYALMQKESDFVMNYGEPCYFFFDNTTTKTRYICLDTGEEGTTLDSTQSAWLSATLNSMPNDYHALVFAHIIYGPTTTWHIGLSPSELTMTTFMDAACSILDTFNANNVNKKVEAIFGGHTHIDANFVTSGGIPIVLTDCDTRQTFTETSAGGGVANHAVGTINEQCFDITTIDYVNKTIKCVRVGRGSNRTITY